MIFFSFWQLLIWKKNQGALPTPLALNDAPLQRIEYLGGPFPFILRLGLIALHLLEIEDNNIRKQKAALNFVFSQMDFFFKESKCYWVWGLRHEAEHL